MGYHNVSFDLFTCQLLDSSKEFCIVVSLHEFAQVYSNLFKLVSVIYKVIESRIMFERNVKHGALSLLVYMLDCLFASVPPARPFQTVEDRVEIKHPKTELKHPNFHS